MILHRLTGRSGWADLRWTTQGQGQGQGEDGAMPNFGDDQAAGNDQVHEFEMLTELIVATSGSDRALTLAEIDEILGLDGHGGAGTDDAIDPTDGGFDLEFVGRSGCRAPAHCLSLPAAEWQAGGDGTVTAAADDVALVTSYIEATQRARGLRSDDDFAVVRRFLTDDLVVEQAAPWEDEPWRLSAGRRHGDRPTSCRLNAGSRCRPRPSIRSRPATRCWSRDLDDDGVGRRGPTQRGLLPVHPDRGRISRIRLFRNDVGLRLD